MLSKTVLVPISRLACDHAFHRHIAYLWCYRIGDSEQNIVGVVGEFSDSPPTAADEFLSQSGRQVTIDHHSYVRPESYELSDFLVREHRHFNMA